METLYQGLVATWPGADVHLRHADPRQPDHGSTAPLSASHGASATCPMKSTATPCKTMMAVAEENYGLAHDYFRLKAKLLELPRLALYDQYAPVGKEVTTFPVRIKRKQVILNAFEAFDPRFRKSPRSFLPKIGSTPRFAKANAAAPSAPRRRRSCIPTFSATTTTTCATS